MPTVTGATFTVGAGRGSIYAVNASFATARGAATGSVDADNLMYPQTSKNGSNYELRRLFLSFDLTSIPSTATITAAKLYFTVLDAPGNADSTTIHVVQTSQDSTSSLTGTDFNNLTFTSGGSITLPTSTGAKSITLNATGIGFLPVGSWAKLGIITGLDLNNSAPAGLNQVQLTSTPANTYLEITYDYPSLGNILWF